MFFSWQLADAEVGRKIKCFYKLVSFSIVHSHSLYTKILIPVRNEKMGEEESSHKNDVLNCTFEGYLECLE